MRDRFEPVFLVGPTAAGKSEVGILLAEEWNAEIVSADSMQVYRGMDIGTAKPSLKGRARVPHHLIDVADVRQPFDAARYRALALSAVREIRERGRLPLVVGGSGMYLRALTEGLFAGPGADAALRAELESHTVEELLERLKRMDPVAASKIDVRNKRRLVRAVEVCALTGKPISSQQTEWRRETGQRTAMFFLERDRADLYARIDRRVDAMFEDGLIRETERLLSEGLADNPTASAAAGYREVIEFLRGNASLNETKERVKQRTRQLAKRQLTWFRHQTRLQVVRVEATAQETKERIQAQFENARSQTS